MIEIYETRNVDTKGKVVFPEKLRKFMHISTGNKVAFIRADKVGDVYKIEIKVINGKHG